MAETVTIRLACGCDAEVAYTTDEASTGYPCKTVRYVERVLTEYCPSCGYRLDWTDVRERIEREWGDD